MPVPAPAAVRPSRLARALACAMAPLALSPLASFAAPVPVPADESPAPAAGGAAPPTTLDAVEVRTTREPAAVAPNLPSPVASVTAAQLDQRTVVNTEDALKYLPAFGIRKRFTGDENATFAVRGTSNRQSARGLVYLDGLLISNLLDNNFSTPPRWSMAFPENLARVDVLYGAYSALYPGNSIGATVLLTTRMPKALEVTATTQVFTQHVDTYGVDESFGGYRWGATLGDRVGGLSFLLGVSHLHNNGQPLVYGTLNASTTPAGPSVVPVTGSETDLGPNGRPRVILGINSEGQETTDLDEATLKLAYDFTDTVRGTATVGYWAQSMENRQRTFLRAADGSPVYAGPVAIDGAQYAIPANFFAPRGRESANTLYGLSLGTHRDAGWNGEASVSYFDMARSQDRAADSGVPGALPGLLTAGDGSRWHTIDLRADHRPASVEAGTHWISIGLHEDGYALRTAVYVLADWRDGGRLQRSGSFGGQTETRALYVQDAWQLAPSWQLTYGARWERWRAFDGARETPTASARYPEREEAHVSPKASLAYDIAPDLRLRVSVARAYRFPTVSELFQGSLSGTAIINTDPNLAPEDDLSRELSAEWALRTGTLRASVYRSDTRDTLFSQTDTTVFPTVTTVQNIDRVRTRGAELAYDAQDVFWPGFDLSANAAYTQATTIGNRRNPASVGKQFYRIPQWRANVAATWRATDRTSLTAAVRYSGDQYNTLEHIDIRRDTFGASSAFLVVDGKLRWRATDRVEFGLGIDNLFDRRYYVYYPYPSRTYVLEAKVRL